MNLGKLRSAYRILEQRPEFFKKYDEIITEQLEIIEVVDTSVESEIPIHYLPHQPVIRKEKKKVRVVYDASAKAAKNLNSLKDYILDHCS